MFKKVATELIGVSTVQQASLTTVTGILGAVVSYAFGGWSDLFVFFFLTMVIDYFTGIGASIADGKGLSSKVGFLGLLKKFFMIVIVGLAHRMDILIGSNFIMTGAIYFYLANELISITENYGRLGLPLPPQVKQIIQVLKNRGETKGEDSN